MEKSELQFDLLISGLHLTIFAYYNNETFKDDISGEYKTKRIIEDLVIFEKGTDITRLIKGLFPEFYNQVYTIVWRKING